MVGHCAKTSGAVLLQVTLGKMLWGRAPRLILNVSGCNLPFVQWFAPRFGRAGLFSPTAISTCVPLTLHDVSVTKFARSGFFLFPDTGRELPMRALEQQKRVDLFSYYYFLLSFDCCCCCGCGWKLLWDTLAG